LQPLQSLDLIASQTAVIREIHKLGSTARVDLARATGLSTQSLTRITKELIDEGLIIEGERRHSGRGQPAVTLSISPGRLVSFGLVIEHDQITCVAAELGGERIFYLKRRGSYENAELAVAEASAMLRTAVEQCPKHAVALGVGVSQSGFFFDEGSRRVASRNDPTGYAKVDLRTALQLPTDMPVFVENDGRAAAVGQAVDGVGKNLDSFFLILMTKGVGGGFVHRGELIRGRLGNAGEVASFVPSAPSHLKPSAESLRDFLRSRWGSTPSDEEIEAALEQKDAVVEEWLDGATRSLQPALEAITALLDPSAIILAGRLLPTVRRAIAERITIEGISYKEFRAPVPQVIVDPRTDCLSVGACALPVADFLYRASA